MNFSADLSAVRCPVSALDNLRGLVHGPIWGEELGSAIYVSQRQNFYLTLCEYEIGTKILLYPAVKIKCYQKVQEKKIAIVDM